MYLHTLEVKNYRSLLHVKIGELRRINTLIGRNNAGKSSILGILDVLNRYLHSNLTPSAQMLPLQYPQASLEITLTFDTMMQEREAYFDRLFTVTEQQRQSLYQGDFAPGRRQVLSRSPMYRQLVYTFRAPQGTPHVLHLREIKALIEDGNWSTIYQLSGIETEGNPEGVAIMMQSELLAQPTTLLRAQDLGSNGRTGLRVTPADYRPDAAGDPLLMWPFRQIWTYFDNAFFFDPYRHSLLIAKAEETGTLAQDGANLAQVLHTLSSNDRPRFQAIEDFVRAALPHVGILHAPISGGETRVSFLAPGSGTLVPLQNMGGGVEQLLMVATALLTTGDESTLFLEEPESHLHAGAQRFLMNRLREGQRQVFLTTHSPTLMNLSRPGSLHQVTLASGRTTVKRVADADAEGLQVVLEDIGARNSDVLFSDAVVFTEGSSDKDTLRRWAVLCDAAFDEHNISILPMGGGEHAERGMPVRSELLAGISQHAPVPHLFVIDRDERSAAEIARLQARLGANLHILARRELENYLLTPRALLAAIRAKHHDNAVIVERVDNATEADVATVIATAAAGLYGHLLTRRIRAELEGFRGGLLTRDIAEMLAAKVPNANFPALLRGALEKRVADHLQGIGLEDIVAAQQRALDAEWADEGQRLRYVPGTEILETVFRHFGSEYDKRKDAPRIASSMLVEEVDAEIRTVVKKAIALTVGSAD